MNTWLTFSLGLLAIWLILFIITKNKKEMLWPSILTAPFGLTEPLFVPEYWNPTSLFNLAQTTGFDIESIIFCFAVGGIAAIVYETIFKPKHIKIKNYKKARLQHRLHILTLLSPFIVLLLLLLSELNIIYISIIAMFIGTISTSLCRPDLKKKILISGLLFTIIYFIFFEIMLLIYPTMVVDIWNLNAISGILILGIPIEELLFALTFGALWSSYYEHIKGYRIAKKYKH